MAAPSPDRSEVVDRKTAISGSNPSLKAEFEASPSGLVVSAGVACKGRIAEIVVSESRVTTKSLYTGYRPVVPGFLQDAENTTQTSHRGSSLWRLFAVGSGSGKQVPNQSHPPLVSHSTVGPYLHGMPVVIIPIDFSLHLG